MASSDQSVVLLLDGAALHAEARSPTIRNSPFHTINTSCPKLLTGRSHMLEPLAYPTATGSATTAFPSAAIAVPPQGARPGRCRPFRPASHRHRCTAGYRPWAGSAPAWHHWPWPRMGRSAHSQTGNSRPRDADACSTPVARSAPPSPVEADRLSHLPSRACRPSGRQGPRERRPFLCS